MADVKATEPEQSLFEDAARVLPGGSFGNVAGDLIVREGRGGRVWDVEGKEYIDFLLGSGPMLVGHAHPEVNAAIEAQLAHGTTFFANNEQGIRLAEEIVAAIACADKVRFVSTGSEATLYAMRVARAYRKRDKVLKFEGGFHGMSDYALMSMAPKRPGNFPQATPDTSGIPHALRDEVLIAPYNDAEAATDLIRQYRDDLAGVIVEPQQRIIPPKPGFLEALREATRAHDIPLIFDEVVTGFRHAYGGGQAYYGVTPDLCALGKVIGGGFPLAAIAGRDDIMAHFDMAAVGTDEFVKMIGTLSGNPVAATAGLATLDILRRPDTYEQLFATGRELMDGLRRLLDDAGLPAQVVGEPPMFDVVFTDQEVTDYRSCAAGDQEMLSRFTALLKEHGVLKGEAKFYVSTAHDDKDVEQTLEACAQAIDALVDRRH